MYQYAIANNEEFSEGTHRIVAEQMDYIIHCCRQPNEDIHEFIHEIRKALKRIRAALRLVKKDVNKDIFSAENIFLRDISRKFSEVRDLHVLNEAFMQLCETKEIDISEEREQELRKYLKTLEDDSLNHLTVTDTFGNTIQRVQIAKKRMSNINLEKLGPHTIFEGVGKIYEKGQQQMNQTQEMPTDKNLHEMRKLVKHLFHLVQLMQPAAPEFFKGFIHSLRDTAKYLGEDHDLSEMARFFYQVDEDVFSRSEKELFLTYIDQQRQQLQVDIWPLVAKIFTESPKDFSRRIESYWLLGRQ